MSKTKVTRVTEEELAALEAYRNSVKTGTEVKPSGITADQQALADAFVQAIERTRPPEKKTTATRKPNNPWTPKDGSPKLKMKRTFYHHGILLGERVSNDEIALLNQVKPGRYCDGYVVVTLRKDKGIDIDYPVRTASQRLRLVNTYGIRSFAELLQRIIDEHSNPKKYRKLEDADLYEDGV